MFAFVHFRLFPACPAGEYRSEQETGCQSCPNNTVTTGEAAPLCPCLDGYFRSNHLILAVFLSRIYSTPSAEPASTACTSMYTISLILEALSHCFTIIEPPSEPLSVSVTASATTISIRWLPPAEDGERSDVYFELDHSDPDNPLVFTGKVFLNGQVRRYTFSGLRPYTQYVVRVIAQNGVSDQDQRGTRLRTVEKCTRTLSACKFIYYYKKTCQARGTQHRV